MIFELNLLIKSSILLLGATVLVTMFRKASASTRHTLWAMGLLAALLFPLASLILPEISVPVLRDSHARIGSPPIDGGSVRAVGVLPERPGRPETAAAVSRFTLAQWIALVWAMGSVVVGIRSFLGLREVRRLRRMSRPVEDAHWLDLAASVQQELRLSAPLQLRIGEDRIPPMMWGILKYTVLLPAAATGWTRACLHDVLAHELAHAKRRDGIIQIMVQSVCALYWFNPLVWYAAYRMQIERERACDDYVLSLGINAEDYADHLLQIARSVTSSWVLTAVSMIHRSGFESRLRLILDPKRNRRMLSRRSILGLISCGVLLTALSATVHIVAAQATPKWAGTWKLNKEKSNFGGDVKLYELIAAVESLTIRLERGPDGLQGMSELVGTRPGQRQRVEFSVPFGVRTDIKDVNLVAAMIGDGTILVTPVGDDALEVGIQQGPSSANGRFQVSDDGNTLTESVIPGSLRIVFDRQL
jgi:beta-lactamase regulating signal transducer with metallopeptidase domain